MYNIKQFTRRVEREVVKCVIGSGGNSWVCSNTDDRISV